MNKPERLFLGPCNTLYRWTRSYGMEFRGEDGWVKSEHTLKSFLAEGYREITIKGENNEKG